MTTSTTTTGDTTMTSTTTLRRCIGSKTFGIEPHEAPIADFPVQPSRKDGLGLVCAVHWTEYTRALRQAAKARQAGAAPTADVVEDAIGEVIVASVDAADEWAAIGAAVDAAIASEAAKGLAPRRSAKKATTTKRVPTPRNIEVQQAEALIAEVDALPADEHLLPRVEP